MAEKPTYEELVQRINALEQEKLESNMMKKVINPGEEWATHKIESKMSPEIPIPEVDLDSIIDSEAIQSIMDDFYYLTNMATAILDLKGNVIEATGWQDICTKFHRVNPKTACNCTESDLFLAKNLKPGEFVHYKCKNGLWDVATPLYVGSKHLGNIYAGQFFYDDEQIDEDFFIKQAEIYGFDKDSYIDAFRRIPRYNRETVKHLISLLVKLTAYISKICLVNIQLEKESRERKQAQEALKESETHLRTVIRTIPDLVWLKDQQGIYLSCNPRFERFFGAKEKDIIGKTDYDFVDKELADSFRRHDQVAMVMGKPSKNEEEVTFADDGHREILETIKTPMYRSDGQLAGVLGIGRDITDRKQADEDKSRLEEQYHQAQKVESIGRLAGGVAHDLNNLLSPILGYSEILLDDLGPDDARREYVDEILASGLRARDLVRQLLAFGRKQTLEYKPLNLNKTVRRFEKLLQRTIREDIEIEILLSPDIPIVMADIVQIEQVIMNLAVNAADAMPEGGRFTIETARANLDEDYAATHEGVEPGEYVMLAVSDTGCGMDDETREHLFEPFFSTKGEEGTGLGLATVHGIVKQHGGSIWFYSEPGIGTTFKVYLPVPEEPRVEERIGKKTATALKGSQTILLVEDNEQVRHLALAILERQGYTVLVAENGAEALTILAAHDAKVHLLLTDVIMPGINGRELFAKVAGKYPDLKVIYMSGYTDNMIAHSGVLDEGVQFVQKPFSVRTLAAKVREVLDTSVER